VKGLLLGAKARIIVNGLYTKEAEISGGVRQGDPPAPMLFAISMQPLITYIDHQIAINKLPTIKVSPNLVVCHMLFAYNIGIFIPASEISFIELRNCIAQYKAASGAKLNLQKSIKIPIAMETIPRWITETGSSIAQEGQIYKYLGAPFGLNLMTSAVQNFCLDKLAKRITALKPHNISFLGRAQLIRQGLLAMPVCQALGWLLRSL
jgi:hypothetical protein